MMNVGNQVVMYNQVKYMRVSRATTFYVIKDRDLAESCFFAVSNGLFMLF